MREAMEMVGLTSGQIAYRMGVSDGAVRGWTTGRRGITPDDLVRFADIVGYPVEYFLYFDYLLPRDFSLRQEVRRLSEQVAKLVDRVTPENPDEQLREYLRESLGIDEETIGAIRQIIEDAKTKSD